MSTTSSNLPTKKRVRLSNPLRTDRILYFLIGSMTVAVGWEGAVTWKFFIAVPLGGLVALKAKRSDK